MLCKHISWKVTLTVSSECLKILPCNQGKSSTHNLHGLVEKGKRVSCCPADNNGNILLCYCLTDTACVEWWPAKWYVSLTEHCVLFISNKCGSKLGTFFKLLEFLLWFHIFPVDVDTSKSHLVKKETLKLWL